MFHKTYFRNVCNVPLLIAYMIFYDKSLKIIKLFYEIAGLYILQCVLPSKFVVFYPSILPPSLPFLTLLS